MPVGCARDLGQVRDRDHLCARREPAQGVRDGVRRPAADTGVDLVEHERLAARDGGQREGDPRQLASRGGLGQRREREPGVRPDQEDGVICARRARLSCAHLDRELADLRVDLRELPLCRLELGSRCLGGVVTLFERGQRTPRLVTPLDELAERLGAIAAAKVGEPVQLALDVLEPPGVAVERREEAEELGRRLPELQLRLAQHVARRPQLGREAFERLQRPLGARDQVGGPFEPCAHAQPEPRGRSRRELGYMP